MRGSARPRPRWCPPRCCEPRASDWASAVYLLAYLAFSGFIYYVTLFFQNIEQWSALRTGLSWLFFCIPYFVVARLGKRLARWLPVAWAVGSGCFIAAAGMLGMSQLMTTTPFSWPAACYIVVGVGFGLMVPAGSSAAMAEVPPGSSGIGSALFNSCRQIGTAMGLAILGSVAASVILADWHQRAGSLPQAERQPASQLAADVAGGQAHLVAASAGQDLLNPAIASFLRGFEVALLLAGVILAAAGAVGIRGLRHLPRPGVPATPDDTRERERMTRHPFPWRSRKSFPTIKDAHLTYNNDALLKVGSLLWQSKIRHITTRTECHIS